MNEKNIIQLCPICETGKRDYLLDKHSIFCSHIGCLKDGNCSQYVPLLVKDG